MRDWWGEAYPLTNRVRGVRHKSFRTLREAEGYIRRHIGAVRQGGSGGAAAQPAVGYAGRGVVRGPTLDQREEPISRDRQRHLFVPQLAAAGSYSTDTRTYGVRGGLALREGLDADAAELRSRARAQVVARELEQGEEPAEQGGAPPNPGRPARGAGGRNTWCDQCVIC